jgi:hypothetical protein
MATEQSEEATMSPTRRELITAMAAAAITNPACALPNEHTQSQGKPPLLSPLSKALLQEFGLKYPIFEAPHGPQTSPELAIAVSNAGAMGALASLDTPEMARSAVAKVRPGTKGYFVVNFILQFVSWAEYPIFFSARLSVFSLIRSFRSQRSALQRGVCVRHDR